jgi:hypothetical protein
MNSNQNRFDDLAALIETAIRLQTAAESSRQDLQSAITRLSQVSTTVAYNAQANLDTAVKKSISDAASGFTTALTNANVQAKTTTNLYKKAGDRITLKLFAWLSLAYIVGIAVLSAIAWFFVFPEAQKSTTWEGTARHYYSEAQKICKAPSVAKTSDCKPYVQR